LFDTPLPDYMDPGSPEVHDFLEAKALEDGYTRQRAGLEGNA